MILVALCFVAVMAIVLGSYIAVCSRAMQLSNRSFQSELSKQLAEAGIDEALRAFNKNDWSDWTGSGMTVDWDTATYAADKRAVATISFPSTKFGQGVTAEVKVRVDNNDAHVLGSAWSDSTNYRINDVVGYNGTWYTCMVSHVSSTANQPPNLSFWAQAPIPWKWISNFDYAIYDIVNESGSWYRCIASHTGGDSFDVGSNWLPIPSVELFWTPSTSYTRGALIYRSNDWYYCTDTHPSPASWDGVNWVSLSSPTDTWSVAATYSPGDFVYLSGAWYRCEAASTSNMPPNPIYWSTTAREPYISWRWTGNNNVYALNDVVFYNDNWYRYISATTTSNTTVPSSSSRWENALSASWDWNSSDDYNIGDVVYLSGSFYRCIQAHTTSHTPPNTTYWSTEPPFSTYWDENKNYVANDVVRYRGSWYLNLTGTNTRPGINDDDWAIAPNSITPWSSAKTFHVDEIVSASGNWYRCKKDHTNQAVGTDNTYWVQLAGPSYAWSASTGYAANSYVSYAGAWYKCLTATTANAGQSPNNTTYWTPTWSQSAGVTTGTPVVYAEAVVTLGDGTTSRTQLRALVDPAPLFPNAAGANTTLTITGGTGRVDSYDSELPAVSSDPDGDNYVASDAGYSAVLAAGTSSASGTSTLLTIGDNTDVRGYASAPSSSSSPFAPRATFGSSAVVKNVSSPASPNTDLTQVSRTPYIPLFDIQTPIQQTSITTSLPSTSASLNLGTPGAATPSVYYYSGNLTIAFNEIVNINGPVILRINGYLRCNTGTFKVNSTGSVVVYSPYYLRSYASAGGFQNLTKDPKKMLFISTSATSLTAANYLAAPSSDPEFYGAIYLPNTTATLGLDVRTGVDVYGALSAREITFSTEANLHYDTSLRYATFTGVDQPYTVTAWRELPATEQATLP